jgi:uncharacterized iron-regulated membrane protein
MANAAIERRSDARAATRLYARLWRWHFFAAFIVIPFVLWQSVTGTLYLWSERWIDAVHPELRFVRAQGDALPVAAQIAAVVRPSGDSPAATLAATQGPRRARAATTAHHGPRSEATAGIGVQRVLIPLDDDRSTAVVLQRDGGLPYPIFVDPYSGEVLGMLSAGAWLPGLSRALHGGWPLGVAGSWLLEVGDGWAVMMIATGLYLWWPRGRGWLAALWPRWRNGKRVLLRDLHSCVAVWFSLMFLFFLISALPWTAFWGETLLSKLEAVTGQSSPAGFSNGGASLAQLSGALQSIDEAVREARSRGVTGTLDIRLAPGPSEPIFIVNTNVAPSEDRILVADVSTAAVRGDYRPEDLPTIPRLVALGVHVHQGDFGTANLAINTAFALSLVWLSVTGALSWWNRRPAKRGLAAPRRVGARLSRGWRVAICAACVLLPLLGASLLAIWALDCLLGHRVQTAARA